MTAVDPHGVAGDENHDGRRRGDQSGAVGRTPDLVAQSVATLTALRTLLSTLRARMESDEG